MRCVRNCVRNQAEIMRCPAPLIHVDYLNAFPKGWQRKGLGHPVHPSVVYSSVYCLPRRLGDIQLVSLSEGR